MSAEPAQLQAWERSAEHPAWLLLCGVKADAWDIEAPHVELLHSVILSHPGPVVRSARGGLHLYTQPVRKGSPTLHYLGAWVGELKGARSTITIPPSVTTKGAYSWELGPWEVPLPVASPALLALVPPRRPRAPVVPIKTTAQARAELHRVARLVAAGASGNRNKLLFWAARHLTELGLPEQPIADVLARAAAAAGLGPKEAAQTVASGIKRGAADNGRE